MSTLVALKRGMFLTNGNFGGRHGKEKENKKYLMIPYCWDWWFNLTCPESVWLASQWPGTGPDWTGLDGYEGVMMNDS
jgi:hypothetical protein